MARSSITSREFRAFYRRYYGFVWAAVRRLGVAAALVDDAAQDTFVVAYRRRAELSTPEARPWLYGIARGIASNYRRTARRADRKHRAIAQAAPEPAAAVPREPQVLLHDLDRFLHELPARDRELFVLSEVEGFTGPELARALGCNMSTAYGRIRTLRQRFALQVSDDEALVRAREEQPRATARGWALLLPSLRASEPGWLGLGSAGTTAVGLGLGGTIAAVVVLGMVALGGRSASHAAPTTEGAEREAIPGAREVASARPEPAARVEAPSSPRPSPTLVAAESERVEPSSEPSRAKTTASPGRSPADPVDDLAEQNALLREATQALAAGDPSRALAAMQRHAQRFPGSVLADLRTALRVEALCAQGKHAQARGEARAWVTAHPASPTRQRILAACSMESARAGQDNG